MASILIVEDDEGLRELLVEHLELAGHRCFSVANGKEALKLLDAPDRAFELVLTDMFMPERDGIEVVMACKQRAVRVIGMSGGDVHGRTGTLNAAGHLGAAHVLKKPFSLEELARLIDTTLGGTAGT